MVVVAVPAAVGLNQCKIQVGATGERDILIGDEHGFTGLIATTGSGVDSPGGFVVAVDGVFSRSGNTRTLAVFAEVLYEF